MLRSELILHASHLVHLFSRCSGEKVTVGDGVRKRLPL